MRTTPPGQPQPYKVILLCLLFWKWTSKLHYAMGSLFRGTYTQQFVYVLSLLSCVQFIATLWTVAHQPPQSMGFFRQEYWSRSPFPFPGDLPDLGTEPMSLALQVDSLLLNHRESPQQFICNLNRFCVLQLEMSFFLIIRLLVRIFQLQGKEYLNNFGLNNIFLEGDASWVGLSSSSFLLSASPVSCLLPHGIKWLLQLQASYHHMTGLRDGKQQVLEHCELFSLWGSFFFF